uniref:Secreted protein n=1 Tax=Streptomyces sp. NBC_00049 TaxID=2903617 RepID=A0AAU2K2C4_9ACTN
MPDGPPGRSTAWAEGVQQLREAATTEPGRLRIIGAALAALILLFGVVSLWEISGRSTAADDVVERSQPLSADAASIYRSLADADTASSSGFLLGAQEPREVRQRYEKDIANASKLLVSAAANTAGNDDSREQIALLSEQLPRYTGLIEQARANNRQGLPLGGAYLRYANEQMTTQLLPAAQRLYEAETGRLYTDYDDARSWPLASLATGLIALAALAWAQRRNYRRTNRVFNHGLVAATAASVVVLLWLTVGHTVARADLSTARADGQESLKVLNDARIASLQARAGENLTLVARGAVLAEDKKSDKYDVDFTNNMKQLDAGLATALRLADDEAGQSPVTRAADGVKQWKQRHAAAREADLKGDYEAARDQVVGGEKHQESSGAAFDTVDASLEQAVAHEQREFTRAARDGLGALGGLVTGAAALAVVGAAAALLGIGRRLSEYR